MNTVTSNLHSLPNSATAAAPELTTEFVDAFKAEFLQPPGTIGFIWPASDSSDEVIADEFGTFMEVLLRMQRILLPPPIPSGDALRDRIIQFVTDQKWPKQEGPPLPPEWNTDTPQKRKSGRLTEIWLICRELLKAAHVHGGGGQPAQIPPH